MKNESTYITGDTSEIAERYFDIVARYFPVMCSSDEFHFMPRAEKATRYSDRLDNLDADAIAECISHLKEFRIDLDRLSGKTGLSPAPADSEASMDLELLKSSVSGILIELEEKQTWRKNPLLYLKVAFIGLDHALQKPFTAQDEIRERVHARMRAIPRLLEQAAQNLTVIPELYRDAASDMLADCISYLDAIEILDHNQEFDLDDCFDDVRTALDAFASVMKTIPSTSVSRADLQHLEATLRDHLMSERSIAEVFDVGIEEWHRNLELLKRIQARVDPHKSWGELYDA